MTELRIDALRRIFTDLGLPAGAAGDHAWPAYGFYIGHHQLARNPETAGSRPGDLEYVVELLTAGA